MGKVQALSKREFESRASAALRRIFLHDDPFREAFAPSVEAREILADAAYELPTQMVEAIRKVVSARGETGFYVAISTRSGYRTCFKT